MAVNLTPDEIFEVFGDADPNQYAAEAKERWGDTDAYRESHRRTSGYTKADWEQVRVEGEQVLAAFMSAMNAGLPPTSAEAMAAAEGHRRNINDRFYPCSYEMQVNLAEMYLADPRFTAYYDDRLPGLAKYVADAIFANALANS